MEITEIDLQYMQLPKLLSPLKFPKRKRNFYLFKSLLRFSIDLRKRRLKKNINTATTAKKTNK